MGVKLFAIETEPQKKRTLHAMARRCILYPSVMTTFGEAVLTKSLMQTILIVLALREIKAHHNSITGRGFAAGVGG